MLCTADEPEDPSEFDYVIEFRDSEQIKNLNEIRCKKHFFEQT